MIGQHDAVYAGKFFVSHRRNARLISFVHVGRATGANEKRQVLGAENLCQMPPDNISPVIKSCFRWKFRTLSFASLSETNQCSTSNLLLIATLPHFILSFTPFGKQPRHPPTCIFGRER